MGSIAEGGNHTIEGIEQEAQRHLWMDGRTNEYTDGWVGYGILVDGWVSINTAKYAELLKAEIKQDIKKYTIRHQQKARIFKSCTVIIYMYIQSHFWSYKVYSCTHCVAYMYVS